MLIYDSMLRIEVLNRILNEKDRLCFGNSLGYDLRLLTKLPIFTPMHLIERLRIPTGYLNISGDGCGEPVSPLAGYE
jgi:hypothetical protein